MRSGGRLFTLLSGILLVWSAQEAGAGVTSKRDCANIRLSSGHRSVNYQGVRNQGEIGVCYAQVAAQMIDAWRATNVPESELKSFAQKRGYQNFETSEIDAALLYGLNEKKINCPKTLWSNHQMSFIEGGQVCTTVKQIINKGSCSSEAVERYVSNADSRQIKKRKPLNRELISAIYQAPSYAAYCKTQPLYSESGGFCPKSEIPSEIAELIEGVAPVMHGNLRDQIERPIRQAIEKLEAGPCKNRQPVPPSRETRRLPVCENEVFKDSDHGLLVRKSISQRLGSGGRQQQPIGIGFCANVIDNPGLKTTYSDWEQLDETADPNKCGQHISMIVGQRMKGGKCQFLLRNTWGKYRWNGVGRWERDDQNPEDLWMDAEVLSSNTFETFELK